MEKKDISIQERIEKKEKLTPYALIYQHHLHEKKTLNGQDQLCAKREDGALPGGVSKTVLKAILLISVIIKP